MPWFVLYPVEPVDAPRGTGNFNSTVIVFLGNVFFNTGARAFDELWVYWEFIGGGCPVDSRLRPSISSEPTRGARPWSSARGYRASFCRKIVCPTRRAHRVCGPRTS